MLRDRIKAELKDAMKAREERKTATLRLITAALKERDIAARSKGVNDGIDETE
ncbi:MAG: GatB/YqeY domain-containing protein, partial [Rhodospirillaceae bacterium]|nr:GatB/YqeY domain-containing protein [Rhodospirillaceae bacterium]